jgi:hypothetical protein
MMAAAVMVEAVVSVVVVAVMVWVVAGCGRRSNGMMGRERRRSVEERQQ